MPKCPVASPLGSVEQPSSSRVRYPRAPWLGFCPLNSCKAPESCNSGCGGNAFLDRILATAHDPPNLHDGRCVAAGGLHAFDSESRSYRHTRDATNGKRGKDSRADGPADTVDRLRSGAYLSELEFYETDSPVREEDRNGLAQFAHFLAFVALRAQSSRWKSSVVPPRSHAQRALESHRHLAGWPGVPTRGLPY